MHPTPLFGESADYVCACVSRWSRRGTPVCASQEVASEGVGEKPTRVCSPAAGEQNACQDGVGSGRMVRGEVSKGGGVRE